MTLQLVIKAISTLFVVFVATFVAKKYPGIGGIIAVMPLVGLIIFIWTYLESQTPQKTMVSFTTGALWGILPTIGFYVVALIAFNRGLTLLPTLLLSLGIWLIIVLVLLHFIR